MINEKINLNNTAEPTRIAQIVGKWVGGGVESVIMNYYKNIDRTKIQFDFICDNDSTNIPYEEIETMGGKVILIPSYTKIFRYHKELKNVLEKGKYKIVHSHINTLSVFSLLAAKSANVPIRIAHSHSTTNKKEIKKNIIKQLLKPFSKIFATNYMCCSELAGRWLFGNKAYDDGKVFLLNNAIDVEKFIYNEKIRNEVRKKIKITNNQLVIGHIGRFVEQKNHKFLIEIFNEVIKINKNAVLILIGQGPLLNEVKKEVSKFKLDNNVKMLGQVNDAYKYYQAFDIFILPSLYEGLPVVGVEAQSAGLPVLLSDAMTKETKIIETTKFVSLNESATFWANEILESVKNTNRINRLDEIRGKNFDIKLESKKLEKIYTNLLEK